MDRAPWYEKQKLDNVRRQWANFYENKKTIEAVPKLQFLEQLP
jgi:hypothetical protein